MKGAGRELSWHDVDFKFAFLNDGGTAQGQTLIWVMILKSFPHGCHQAVTPSSPLDPHLKHLPSLPFTSKQVAQQSKIAARVLVTEFLQQALTIIWIDGGEVTAVNSWLSLRFSLNQRY